MIIREVKNLNEEVIKNLLQITYPHFVEHFDVMKPKAFYSELYQVTYNHVEPNIDHVMKHVEDVLKGVGVVGELFSGSGWALTKVKEKFPNIDAVGIDSSGYFKKLDGLRYTKEELIKPTILHKSNVRAYDLVFVSGANSSQCLLRSMADWSSHIETTNKLLKIGGHCITSYLAASDEIKEGLSIEETSGKYLIEFDSCEQFKGLYAEWVQVMVTDNEKGTQTYYDYVLLFEKEDSVKPIGGFKHSEGYTVSFIPSWVVRELFVASQNFKFVETVTGGIDIFRKIG